MRGTSAVRGTVAIVIAIAGVTAGCSRVGPGDASVEAYRLDADVRIGAIDGPDVLGAVIGLQVDADGAMYVAEWNEGSIGVFDAAGGLSHRVGRRGGGPGEFARHPGTISWFADTLVAVDAMANRLNLFLRDGTQVRTFRLDARPVSDLLGAPYPVQLLADGSVLGMFGVGAHLIDAGTVREMPIVRLSPDGATVDTLFVIALGNAQLGLPLGTSFMYTLQPVSDAPLWSTTADGAGFVLVDRTAETSAAATFRVTRLSWMGDTVFARDYPYNAELLEGARADSIVERLARTLAEGGRFTEAELRQSIREHAYLPARLPPITRLIAGRDGTIWLRREELGDVVDWDVLDAEGRAIMRVHGPRRLTVHQADRTSVWGVELDDLDVNYVVRYRVVAAGSAPLRSR